MITRKQIRQLPKGDYALQTGKLPDGSKRQRLVGLAPRIQPPIPALLPQLFEEFKLIKLKRSKLSRRERDTVEAQVQYLLTHAHDPSQTPATESIRPLLPVNTVERDTNSLLLNQGECAMQSLPQEGTNNTSNDTRPHPAQALVPRAGMDMDKLSGIV